jgi:hypothetical protein
MQNTDNKDTAAAEDSEIHQHLPNVHLQHQMA